MSIQKTGLDRMSYARQWVIFQQMRHIPHQIEMLAEEQREIQLQSLSPSEVQQFDDALDRFCDEHKPMDRETDMLKIPPTIQQELENNRLLCTRIFKKYLSGGSLENPTCRAPFQWFPDEMWRAYSFVAPALLNAVKKEDKLDLNVPRKENRLQYIEQRVSRSSNSHFLTVQSIHRHKS